MKVRNMLGSSGREVPNQFEITTDQGVQYFQSYRTIIVKINKKGQVFLDKNAYAYSNTTIKYRNLYLGCDSKEVEQRIKSGQYKLTDLNK